MRLSGERQHGRPWSRPLLQRVLLACIALRTNLTFRELAALVGTTKSTAHRIVADLVPRFAALASSARPDRRWSWIVDGTLVPTRDHTIAARPKNDRWSCDAQVLVRSGNRNDLVHYRGSVVERLCRAHGRVLADGGYRGVPELLTPVFRSNRIVRDRGWRRHRGRRARVEHAIARLKDWRVLRDHRRRGRHLQAIVQAVTFLHNLRVDLRDKS